MPNSDGGDRIPDPCTPQSHPYFLESREREREREREKAMSSSGDPKVSPEASSRRDNVVAHTAHSTTHNRTIHTTHDASRSDTLKTPTINDQRENDDNKGECTARRVSNRVGTGRREEVGGA